MKKQRLAAKEKANEESNSCFLLNEIMKAGNFGHHDEQLKSGRYASSTRLMMQWLHHTM